MPTSIPDRREHAGIDWLNPLSVLFAVVTVYVVGRLLIEQAFRVPPIWGGSAASERKALILVAGFTLAASVGVWLVPRRPRLCVQISNRGPVGRSIGRGLVGIYLAVGLGAAVMLLRHLGGLSRAMENQAAWASQLKEMGLTPLYGLSYLFIHACILLSFRATIAGRFVRASIWFCCVLGLAIVLGRRIMILFAGLPLLASVHYHVRRLNWRHVTVLGLAGFTLFTSILLLRLNTDRGSIAEAVGTSLEYALYDALVITVDRAKDLAALNASYFLRHPDEFWGANTAALFFQRITGFKWLGGATPPSAVGTLWVYFGTLGLLTSGIILGYVMGRLRVEAKGSPPAALLYGFVLFYWFDFLRNGDIVMELKLFARNAVLLCALLLCFYRLRIASTGRTTEHTS